MNDSALLRACVSFSGIAMLLPRERFVLRPSVYAVVRDRDRVLLVTNTRSGRYYLPGGGLEPGESLAEALQREVREEAGITITLGPLLAATEDFFYYDPSDSAYHALLFYYQARADSLLLSSAFQTDDGENNPQWVPIASLRPDQFHNHGERLLTMMMAE